MKNIILTKVIFYMFVTLFIQVFVPAFYYNGVYVVSDILIIFLTYLGFFYGRFYTIILGFIAGLTQDLVSNIDILGSMAFTKSIISFGLGGLFLYRNVWSIYFRMAYIFFIYFVHFFLFNFIKYSGVPISLFTVLKIVLLNSILCFMLLIIIDKVFFNKGILSR